MFNHLSCINFSLQYFVSLHSSKICFTSSFSKHNGHLPLSAFLVTPFSCYIPAISHAIPLCFLEQHSMYKNAQYAEVSFIRPQPTNTKYAQLCSKLQLRDSCDNSNVPTSGNANRNTIMPSTATAEGKLILSQARTAGPLLSPRCLLKCRK
jgi:hypothetical protein